MVRCCRLDTRTWYTRIVSHPHRIIPASYHTRTMYQVAAVRKSLTAAASSNRVEYKKSGKVSTLMLTFPQDACAKATPPPVPTYFCNM